MKKIEEKMNFNEVESEDEKMRKTLIAYLKKHSEAYSLEPAEINLKEYIAWLEKLQIR
jgi:hypothetical protein